MCYIIIFITEYYCGHGVCMKIRTYVISVHGRFPFHFVFYSPPLLPFWITAESAGKRPYVRNVLNIIYYFWLDTKTTIDRNRRGEIPLDEYILENNNGSSVRRRNPDEFTSFYYQSCGLPILPPRPYQEFVRYLNRTQNNETIHSVHMRRHTLCVFLHNQIILFFFLNMFLFEQDE